MKILIRLIFLCLYSFTFPQNEFYTDATSTHLPGGLTDHSMDAEFIDVDGDTDLDIVVAVEYGQNVLLINDGSGKFSHGTALTDKQHDSEDIAIGRFNDDAHLDILFVAEDDFINELYLGDGVGGFTPANNNIPVGLRSNAVITYDFNKDNFLDIYIGNSTQGNQGGYNTLLINDQKGVFLDESSTRIPSLQTNTQDMAIGDVDNDGDVDIVVANEEDNKLYLNDGNGNFVDSSSQLDIRNGIREITREVALGDIDGDKDLDIVYFNIGQSNGDPQNRILINDGKGVFTDETSSRLPDDNSSSWDGALYDVNNDSILDIITADVSIPDIGGDLYSVYINDGTGKFTDETSTIFPPNLREAGWDVEAGDLNGDGYLDFYLCARSNYSNGNWSQDRLLFGVPGKATQVQRNSLGVLHEKKSKPIYVQGDKLVFQINSKSKVLVTVWDVSGSQVGEINFPASPLGQYTLPLNEIKKSQSGIHLLLINASQTEPDLSKLVYLP